jgi:signal transduction histidine kinase
MSASAPYTVDKGVPRRLLSEFNVAFSLMSIIPLLICCYLITVKFFTIKVLEGLNGVYFLMAVLIALLGLLLARIVIRRVIEQLMTANAKLKELYEQQASFVGNVAHEFRSPLSVFKGALDNLADGLHGELTADQREPLEMCQKEANRLTRLVSDLLDLSRIEAGKLPMKRQEVVVQEVLRSVAQLYAGSAKERGLSITVDVPELPARIVGDRDRLQQVFVNLMSNAIKFTEQGGITLRLMEELEFWRAEVTDTGVGIVEGDRDRVFNKFERIDSRIEGSGLGLPIARDIVQLHYGRIWVEAPPGGGSRFVVRLPKHPAG